MRRPDKRRSLAEASILRALAMNYVPSGMTYLAILNAMTAAQGNQTRKEEISLRHLKRYLSDFGKSGWVRTEPQGRRTQVRLTPSGYFHVHEHIEGHDVTTMQAVPKELLEPLMVKGVWRLTDDQVRYFSEYLSPRGSLLVLLPTGAGKTLIATVEAYRNYLAHGNGSKVLYVSPYKAINSQTIAEFQKVLVPLGMRVVRQDGDHHPPEEELSRANVIVSTFESAEIAARQRQSWVEKVSMVIIDELTVLDSTRDTIDSRQVGSHPELPRGATLDLLVTGLLYRYHKIGKKVRVVCLGIPNANQPALQHWLGSETAILEPTQISARYEEKIAIFRDVNGKPSLCLVRKDGASREGPWPSSAVSAADRIVEVIMHYMRKFHANSHGGINPILVFVHGRKATSEVATRLLNRLQQNPELLEAMSKNRERNQQRILSTAVFPTTTVKQLADIVNFGLAFHHAGLFPAQRRLVEKMMNEGSLSVLFATTTLSHGVDFPIGAVVVDGRLLEFFRYSRLEYLQIRGRVDHKDPFHQSGRPADVVTVLSDDDLLKGYEKVRELLLGSYPPLNSRSLEKPYLGTWTFKAIQILLSTGKTTQVKELGRMATRSYHYQYLLQGKSDQVDAISKEVNESVDKQFRHYSESGLIDKRRSGFGLGPLGKLAENAGLSFDDAIFLIANLDALSNSPADRLDQTLLRMATLLSEGRDEVQEVLPRIFVYESVPPKLREGTIDENKDKGKLRRNTLLGIMGRWMDEEPIISVIVNAPNFQIYEAGLLVSTRALSRSLNKIGRAIDFLPEEVRRQNPKLENVARKAAILSIRVRFGVKEDVASSEIASVASKVDMDDLVNEYGFPEFLTRVILRLLIEKGVATKDTIREYQGRKAITIANLRSYANDVELVQHVGKYHRSMIEEIARRIVAEAMTSDDAHGTKNKS